MSQAEPLSDVFTYKFSSSLRRRHEKLTRFPEGYLVLDDAIASFNQQFLKVMNLMAPPTSLMHPKIVWRVLGGLIV